MSVMTDRYVIELEPSVKIVFCCLDKEAKEWSKKYKMDHKAKLIFVNSKVEVSKIVHRKIEDCDFLFFVATSYSINISDAISSLEFKSYHCVLLLLDSSSYYDLNFKYFDTVLLPAESAYESEIWAVIKDIISLLLFPSPICTDISDIAYILRKRAYKIIIQRFDPFCQSITIQDRLSEDELMMMKKADKLLLLPSNSDLSSHIIENYSYLCSQTEEIIGSEAHVLCAIPPCISNVPHLALVLACDS